jgi:hypothetical protein
MLSERAEGYARDLRTWLRDGALTRPDVSVVRDGVALPLDRATRIVLHDLDDLIDQAAGGATIEDERWRYLADDLERLHRLATARQSP